jgi:competence protein ComFC
MKKLPCPELADLMADYLAEAYAAELADRDIDFLVPVPIAEETLRRRGFNQAERLATALGERVRLPVVTALAWRGPSRTQTGRNRRERLQRLDGSIVLSQQAVAVAGRTLLLVDDVYTTGTTANTCAMRLREAGARSVYVLTVAR